MSVKSDALTNELPTFIAGDVYPLIFRITRLFLVGRTQSMEAAYA